MISPMMRFAFLTSRPLRPFLLNRRTTNRFKKRATEDPQYSPSEKIISVSDVVKEASEQSENFVFSDNSEEPVFQFEDRLRGKPEERSAKMPEVKGALDPSSADITSAYSPEQGFKEITVDELKDKWSAKEFTMVMDVREDHEFAAGHVPGAINTPLSGLNADYIKEKGLDVFKEKPIAVICGIGKRSAQASVRLSKVLGFTNVTNVAEGTKGWIQRGFEIEK